MRTPEISLNRMTNGNSRLRHPRRQNCRDKSPAAPLTYVRARELEGRNWTKVRLEQILRRSRCQFDTNGPWWRAEGPDRQDIKPVRHTSPNVCGIFSDPMRHHRSAACL